MMATNRTRQAPEAVAAAVAAILSAGVLAIRAATWVKDVPAEVVVRYCGLEADHLHALPAILLHYDGEQVRGYLRGFVSEYRHKVTADPALRALAASALVQYEQLWAVLAAHVK